MEASCDSAIKLLIVLVSMCADQPILVVLSAIWLHGSWLSV